jgi:hypothetical protein
MQKGDIGFSKQSNLFYFYNGSAWTSTGGGSGAPTTATYITQTADAGLSAEQAMGALGTGLVKSTTTTGAQSIYGGTACTNQFPRSLDASGVATCASVGDADVSSITGAKISSAVATATALAANPADCASNAYAQTIAASGNLTCKQVAYSEITSPPTIPTDLSAEPFVTASASGNLSAERVLSNGTNTTVDTGTVGQIKVNLSGSISEASITNLTTDLAAKALATRAINTTAPVTGGGDLSADRTISVLDFVASGASHARGTVPDPGASAGATRYLREDATWVAPPAGGSANAVTANLDFGVNGNTSASVVVTGASWVTAASKIVCAPTMFATGSRAEGADDAIIEGLTVAVHSRVAGTGFTVAGAVRQGEAFGVYAVNCLGS